MISVVEATKLINEHKTYLGNESIPIEDSLGRILDLNIKTDRPQPPYDRVTMDGYAIKLNEEVTRYKCKEIQYAGEAPKAITRDLHAIEVMTGSVLPINADTVVPYEKCNMRPTVEHDFFDVDNVKKGDNIHRAGSDAPANTAVLKRGRTIKSSDIAIMASMGYSEVSVAKRPKVGFISTGNELVEIDKDPKDYQIRSSNNYMIFSHLKKIGVSCEMFSSYDSIEELSTVIEHAMINHEVILLSGGVSKGRYDFVPEALEKVGFEIIFHRVAQRPGKPLLFAKKGTKLAFGLPGNPVSSLVCYTKYVIPAIQPTRKLPLKIPLAEPFTFDKPLTYFLPVVLKNKNYKISAERVTINGSGDYISISEADGLLELPPNKNQYKEGDALNYIPFP